MEEIAKYYVEEGAKRKGLELKGKAQCTWIDAYELKCTQDVAECKETKGMFSRKKIMKRVIKEHYGVGFIVKVFYQYNHLTKKCSIEVSVHYTLLSGY